MIPFSMKHFAANSFSCEEGAASACYHGAVNGVMNEERSSGHIRLREGQVGLFPLFTNFHAIPDLEKRLWLRNFIYPVTIQFIEYQSSIQRASCNSKHTLAGITDRKVSIALEGNTLKVPFLSGAVFGSCSYQSYRLYYELCPCMSTICFPVHRHTSGVFQDNIYSL